MICTDWRGDVSPGTPHPTVARGPSQTGDDQRNQSHEGQGGTFGMAVSNFQRSSVRFSGK